MNSDSGQSVTSSAGSPLSCSAAIVLHIRRAPPWIPVPASHVTSFLQLQPEIPANLPLSFGATLLRRRHSARDTPFDSLHLHRPLRGPSRSSRDLTTRRATTLRIASMSQSNPPLLLTKRLTSFLQSSSSPALPTLLLTTLSGKLLAHTSPRPVSTLRTHATVAASLFAIHTSSSVSLPSALPGAAPGDSTSTSDEEEVSEETGSDEDDAEGRGKKGAQPTEPVTITVQLSGGVVVIRRLKCGLLFVCIGPPVVDASQQHHPPNATSDPNQQLTQHLDASTNSDPNHLAPALANVHVGSPSAESQVSTGGQTNASLDSVGAAGAATIRRHAAELARWLDDKLGTLSVPEDGVALYK